MVPDVAANADPNTGYKIIVHGARLEMSGTSAVAPPYAGLFAAFGPTLGFVSPRLWSNQLCFNDITQGDNGFYRARIGPDASTGLGSPVGTKLAELFAAKATVVAEAAPAINTAPTPDAGRATPTRAAAAPPGRHRPAAASRH